MCKTETQYGIGDTVRFRVGAEYAADALNANGYRRLAQFATERKSAHFISGIVSGTTTQAQIKMTGRAPQANSCGTGRRCNR